jgi:hypothetical protein
LRETARAPSSLEQAALRRSDVPDPIRARPIREGDHIDAGAAKDVYGRTIPAAGFPAGVHNDAEARKVPGDRTH